MGVGALGCVCIYFPLVSWFIRRRKFACGNRSKARCSWQEWLTTELLPATHTLLCFHSGYFCFMYVKKASMNTYQAGGGGEEEKPNLLWLDGRIWWNKCAWLTPFPLPYLIYVDLWREEPIPFARGTWDCLREALQTPLLKISFVNKHLWAWRTNANVSLLPLEMENTTLNYRTMR